MSFDNTGEQLEYVRYGGKWSMLTENLVRVKELFGRGQWGGIHAVYNIYNATRIVEFREWAAAQGVSVLWQNLFQPDYLDPFLHGPAVAAEAAAEIERFYATGLATDAERQFFDNALNTYRGITQERTGISRKFREHISEIENKYHTDCAGQFKKLWPELEEYIK
jgi:hypothetical protein